jgi:outer membrane protein OmpA-like peptidoglycan-associated protein
MKIYLLLLLLLPLTSFAQDISGKWIGTTIQEPDREFYFEMNIEGTGEVVSGTTVIRDEYSGNYGVIAFTGTFKDSILSFKELKLVKEDRSQIDTIWKSNTFYWCIKTGALHFNVSNERGYLTGNWWTQTTCSPGTISVSKEYEEEIEFKSIKDCIGKPASADFMYGMWTGKFTQYACSIFGTYDMILMIDKVDGMKFSGMFIWPASQFSADSRSLLLGEVKGNKIYMNEPTQLSGDPLLIGGVYTSTMTDCDNMKGYWRMEEYGPLCQDPKVLKDGGNYTLTHYKIPTIYFSHSANSLTKESIKKLDELAEFMLKFKNLKIELDGFTDNTGSNAFNIRLSEQRAEAVMNYLLNKGIPQNRMIPKHFGSMKPAAPNKSDEGKMLNRRTEIKLLQK